MSAIDSLKRRRHRKMSGKMGGGGQVRTGKAWSQSEQAIQGHHRPHVLRRNYAKSKVAKDNYGFQPYEPTTGQSRP